MAGLENITVRKSGRVRMRLVGVPIGTTQQVLLNYIKNTLGVSQKCWFYGASWLDSQTHLNNVTLKFRNEEARDDAVHIIQTEIATRNLNSQLVNVPQLPPGFNPDFQPLTAPPGFAFNPGFRPFIPQAPQAQRVPRAYGFNPAQQQAPGPYPGYQHNLPQAQQPVYGYAGLPQLQPQPQQPLTQGFFNRHPQLRQPPPPHQQPPPPPYQHQPPPPPGAGWQ